MHRYAIHIDIVSVYVSDQIAAARIKELEQENKDLKKELKAIQKRLSKYELNVPSSPNGQLNVVGIPMTPSVTPTEVVTPISPQETDALTTHKETVHDDEKVQEHVHDDDDDNMNKNPIRKRPKPPKKIETDSFWLDVNDKITKTDYAQIKKCIPNQAFIDEEDERWKMELWKTDYGEYELRCVVSLVNYNTDQWTEDDVNLLYASVTKYGINSTAAWEKIGENLNREVDDAMEKYSELVKIPLKKLRKMTRVRG